mmetsp:Transcript_18199/g.28575  ORF Transcript_18199/g.28575 Transcript_18199/m.28575 type:complete len:219 (+) Transcript_18199:2687-3343(+)
MRGPDRLYIPQDEVTVRQILQFSVQCLRQNVDARLRFQDQTALLGRLFAAADNNNPPVGHGQEHGKGLHQRSPLFGGKGLGGGGQKGGQFGTARATAGARPGACAQGLDRHGPIRHGRPQGVEAHRHARADGRAGVGAARFGQAREVTNAPRRTADQADHLGAGHGNGGGGHKQQSSVHAVLAAGKPAQTRGVVVQTRDVTGDGTNQPLQQILEHAGL